MNHLKQIIAHLTTLKEVYEAKLMPEEIDDGAAEIRIAQITELINMLK